MNIFSFVEDSLLILEQKMKKKKEELELLESTSVKDLWKRDLN